MTTLTSPLASTDWLADNLSAPDLVILDCTTVQEATPDGSYAFAPGKDAYAKGHVPGAVFCNVLETLADKNDSRPLMMPKPDAFKTAMEALGVSDASSVVLYDRGNHAWAARVWWSLKTYGFDNAAVLDGGWAKWTAEGRPVSTDAPDVKPGSFTPKHQPQRIVAKEEVLTAIDGNAATLIHSLSREEFTGEKQVMPRAGRIKTSVSAPANALINPDTGAYKQKEALLTHYQTAGVSRDRPVIAYCGGGVAACSNALALTLLGFDDVAVYDGSLAEWTSDPDAPMETG
ncbi:sulfurtransferase [Hyphococcus sp.]|uniref:sulfurtransferase n=1 Tax=Hyphococcus sp. TaxID=2038636 RepID=UPI0035C6B44A